MDVGKKISVSVSSYGGPTFESSLNHYQTSEEDRSILETSTNLFNRGERLVRIRASSQVSWLASLSQIKGPTGSVRGHKNVVRKSLENIGGLSMQLTGERKFSSMDICSSFTGLFKPTVAQLDKSYRLERLASFLEDEQDQCVAYTTSLGVVRRTFEDSRRLR